jgi:hypothetical protein
MGGLVGEAVASLQIDDADWLVAVKGSGGPIGGVLGADNGPDLRLQRVRVAAADSGMPLVEGTTYVGGLVGNIDPASTGGDATIADAEVHGALAAGANGVAGGTIALVTPKAQQLAISRVHVDVELKSGTAGGLIGQSAATASPAPVTDALIEGTIASILGGGAGGVTGNTGAISLVRVISLAAVKAGQGSLGFGLAPVAAGNTENGTAFWSSAKTPAGAGGLGKAIDPKRLQSAALFATGNWSEDWSTGGGKDPVLHVVAPAPPKP